MAKKSLLELVEQVQREAEALVEQRTSELKASPTGADLPRDMLRHAEITKGDHCLCRVAKRLLAEEASNG